MKEENKMLFTEAIIGAGSRNRYVCRPLHSCILMSINNGQGRLKFPPQFRLSLHVTQAGN